MERPPISPSLPVASDFISVKSGGDVDLDVDVDVDADAGVEKVNIGKGGVLGSTSMLTTRVWYELTSGWIHWRAHLGLYFYVANPEIVLDNL